MRLTFDLCCVCPDLKYMRQDLDLWSWGDLSVEEMDTLTALQVSNARLFATLSCILH